MLLLDIVFQSGEFISPQSNFWSDIIKAVIPLIISSAVTLAAVYITFNKNKKREEVKKGQFQTDKNIYFKTLIKNALGYLKPQIILLKTWAQGIINDPTIMPPMKIRISNDLERLVNRINQEEHYYAYLECFKNIDADIVTEEFRKIYACLDYFNASMSLMKSAYEDASNHDHELRMDFSKRAEKLINAIDAIIINQNQSVPLKTFLSPIVTEFKQGFKDSADLKFVHEKFIKPFLGQGFLKFARVDSALNTLFIEIRSADTLYERISVENKSQAKEFIEMHQALEGNIIEFELAAKRIIEV
jgi:hypothetical protein